MDKFTAWAKGMFGGETKVEQNLNKERSSADPITLNFLQIRTFKIVKG